jgi:phenylacetate-CoA ligase
MSEARPLYMPEVEAASPDARSVYEDDLVRRAVTHAAEKAPEVGARLKKAGLEADSIQGVRDLARLPVLSKDDLPRLQTENPPFGGMLVVPPEKLRRIYMSPGPIFDPEGDRPDFWRWAPGLWACGFRPEDIVYNTFSYHLTPAGAMMEEGLRAIGCTVIPGGVGNTELQIEFLSKVAATGYVGTPSFLLTMVEQAKDKGLALSLRRAFVAGAPLSPSLRSTLQKDYRLVVFQGYGTADAGALGYECERAEGWHIAPGVFVEVVDPVSGQPVAKGETGEIVVTAPNEVYPLVRFGTGDLSAFMPTDCSCGRTTPRLVGFLGRAGDGVKVRGMFVHTRQIAEALSAVEEVAHFQAVVSQVNHKDELTIRLESKPEVTLDKGEIADILRGALKLRVTVEVLDPGSLPEDAKPLVDNRTWD